MRGEQLSDIARRSALRDRDITYAPFTEHFRRHDLFLTKGALKSVEPSTIDAWRRQGNRVFVDPVDESLDDGRARAADVVVAASRTAYDSYRSQWPQLDVRLLNHHVDPRVARAMAERPKAPQQDHLRVAYFGELVNVVSSEAIADQVDFIHIDTSRRDDAWLSRLPDYNLHYAVRQHRALDAHKPFLKGFTAAACRSNVLIQVDEAEPREWLPTDYPFWLTGDVTEPAILRALDFARQSVGTERWRYASEIMSDIAQRSSPDAIGRELVTLVA